MQLSNEVARHKVAKSLYLLVMNFTCNITVNIISTTDFHKNYMMNYMMELPYLFFL